MEPQKQIENGEEPRLHQVLPLVGGGRGNPMVTVSMTALDETQQARVDAAVAALLAAMVRQALS